MQELKSLFSVQSIGMTVRQMTVNYPGVVVFDEFSLSLTIRLIFIFKYANIIVITGLIKLKKAYGI